MTPPNVRNTFSSLRLEWLEVKVHELAISRARLVTNLISYLIKQWGQEPGFTALGAVYGLSPEITSSAKFTDRVTDVASFLNISTRTVHRHLARAVSKLAAELMDPDPENVLLAAFAAPSGQRRFITTRYEVTLFFDKQCLVTRQLQRLYARSQIAGLDTIRVSHRYETIRGDFTYARIATVTGASIIDSTSLPNGGQIATLELGKSMGIGESFLVEMERLYEPRAQPRPDYCVSSENPIAEIRLRLQFHPSAVPERVWHFTKSLRTTAPPAYSNELALTPDRSGSVDWHGELVDPGYVAGVAWEV